MFGLQDTVSPSFSWKKGLVLLIVSRALGKLTFINLNVLVSNMFTYSLSFLLIFFTHTADIANPEGIAHAQCLADRLRSQLKCGEIAPTRIYASPFIRATHTAHLVAEKLNLKVYIEDGISEWVTPDLLGKDRYVPRSVFELHYLFPYVSKNYRSVLTTHNMQHLWEDETDLYERSQEIINRLVESAGGQSILICTHAPCAQAVALAMDVNANMDPSQSQIPPWPLGGLTMFSRELNTDIGEWSDWTPELMCNTEHMPPGEYRKGAKAWSLPGFVRAKEQ